MDDKLEIIIIIIIMRWFEWPFIGSQRRVLDDNSVIGQRESLTSGR